MVLEIGDTIDGKYGLVAQLGSGGMGTVYLVRHLLLDKQMALKTFSSANLSPLTWHRFQREARAIAKLDHANIVQVFDFGICQGNVPYYTMERLSGQPFSDWLATNGRMPVSDALALFTSVARALSHAHNQGVVHRDIKPGNIFLDYDCEHKMSVKVLDFGLAKLASSGSEVNQFVTDGGLVCGSPLYMSPEQATTNGADWRSDIYSFGCTMFEALTGLPPFIGDCALDTIQMHQKAKPPNLLDVCSELGYRPSLETFMAKLLAKDAADRYQSFDEILVQLNSLTKTQEARQSLSRTPALQVPDNRPVIAALLKTKRRMGSGLEQSLGAFPLVHLRSRVGHGVFALVTVLALSTVALCANKIHAQSLVTVGAHAKTGPVHAFSGKVSDVTISTSYFSTVTAAGERQFVFEGYSNLGFISWTGHKAVPAQGIVTIPAGSIARLHIGDGLGQHPELLARFRPDDFYSVVCTGYTKWDPRVLDAITAHLTGIGDLCLEGCELGKDAIEQINRLDRLCRLDVAETNLTGADIVALKRLKELQYLDVSQTAGISPALAALEGSRNMQDLYARACNLNGADVKAIAKISSLVSLNLEGNVLSDSDIKELSRLHCLSTLSVPGTRLKPACIKSMTAFKGVSCLRIDASRWSKVDRDELQDALGPFCKILCDPYADGTRACLDLRKIENSDN